MKAAPIKRLGKQDREKKVLLGLVEYYIKTGKPVGSNTLKEAGFEDLSSATLRNYFANLEEEGYLSQPHSSGGRLPTPLAYRTYAKAYSEAQTLEKETEHFSTLRSSDSREITAFLQESAETLGKLTQCAVFLSAPRFDHDFVIDLKLVPIDSYRCVCIIITDFGVVQTEILRLPAKLSAFAAKRIEAYFQWRLTGLNPPSHMEEEEKKIAHSFYNEVMMRYIVGYAHFSSEDMYRTGFSHLLNYPEFQDTMLLSTSLSLFENSHYMRLLLKECQVVDRLKFWIGDDLNAYAGLSQPTCSVLAIPYYVNKKVVGACGLLGPMRIPYPQLFSILRDFSSSVSEVLTRNLYKHKISFRQPEKERIYLNKKNQQSIGQSQPMLLEDKR